MCSETAMLLKILLLWIFMCPSHFAGVWDAWGGSEAKLLKNVEKDGKDTIRTVIEALLKLRELRKNLLGKMNATPTPQVSDEDASQQADEGSDSEASCVEEDEVPPKKTFHVDACHILLLQLCKCRNAASCTCEPDPRVPDTIFYRREPRYDAKPIEGCQSMFVYRFLPKRKYVVQIREYACETCPGCQPTRSDEVRYKDCINLSTVRAKSYKCSSGYKRALNTVLSKTTGWVEHKIVPLTTTALAGTRATDGLTHLDHRSRLEYVGRLKPGENVFMANTSDGVVGEFRPRNFWLAQILPPPNDCSAVVWKTRHALPPDCPAGTYCIKIQWFQRRGRDSRRFKLASAQYISLSCIVPVNYPIILDQKGPKLYELSVEIQNKVLRTLNGLVVDD